MKRTYMLRLLAGALVLATASYAVAQAPRVDISMNVFPDNLGNPNGGGAFTLVAKTNSAFGISAISFYVKDVDVTGLTIENDIGALLNGGNPYFTTIGSAINLVYGQNTASGPVVLGVGTLTTSDGPDPLGNPAWDNATRIISGTYSSVMPIFTTAGINETDANTLSTVIGPPFNASINAFTTTVVRVAVPEPGTVALAVSAMLGIVAMRRRR